MLVSTGAKVTEADKDGATAVALAAAHGHLEVVNYLASVAEEDGRDPKRRAPAPPRAGAPPLPAAGDAAVAALGIGGSKRAGVRPRYAEGPPAPPAADEMEEAPRDDRFAKPAQKQKEGVFGKKTHTVAVYDHEIDPVTGLLSTAALLRIAKERKKGRMQQKMCCAGFFGVIVAIVLIVLVSK